MTLLEFKKEMFIRIPNVPIIDVEELIEWLIVHRKEIPWKDDLNGTTK
jgi:hypothetical protein